MMNKLTRDGRKEVEIEDSTWEQLEKDYHGVEALCKRRGINTLEQYVRAVLMMQK